MPLLMLLLILCFQADDQYNKGGFNKYLFKRTHAPTTPVQPVATCASVAMPCTTSLAIVHNPADSLSEAAVGLVVARLISDHPQISAADAGFHCHPSFHRARP